jgi:NAD(P)H-dependent FMN reductase
MTTLNEVPYRPAAASSVRRVVVVSSSVRMHRISPSIAEWVAEAAEQRDGVEVDLLDLGKVTLPADDLLGPGGEPRSEVADRLDAADAFVFVTPEYNHSFPAPLKRLVDAHYREWRLKPATVVAYGVHGGHAAIEQLRGVLAELNIVTTRRVMGLRAPWESLDEAGRYTPDEAVAKGLAAVLAELAWWTDVLADARASRPFPG